MEEHTLQRPSINPANWKWKRKEVKSRSGGWRKEEMKEWKEEGIKEKETKKSIKNGWAKREEPKREVLKNYSVCAKVSTEIYVFKKRKMLETFAQVY